ncbi:MATE family efflux transporter [Heyndrickxia oleronia]|jgi:MATE family multidrug resistance protein|uniref:MATE family efflux transporter n=1 Tax=Heyndrickxia oleronia TaxID=38875 RepID=UPI00242D88FC|nr:MATE family efflux transporter [Heyndrickxia oleronia]MCI1590019.1 MATE family efflux transporter [Heyndrickxia oleronia]MCI1613355.1 MATE family efflux transporter [Heyndrickxia oleronia]MCI1744737.1 MATE family efflux transporter [Heyndrickxia oleronia]MCI1761304.1 MATE family efflux transporter [Heyndrickxia oleronia]
MNQTFTIKEKTKQIFILLIPILITQLGMFSMVFFNTILSGKYNSSDLAGVAIGSSIWNPVFTGLSGILLAVSPIVAQRFGERKSKEVSSIVVNGIYLSLMIAIVVIILGFFLLNPLLDSMNLETRVQHTVHAYLVGLSFGIIPLFIFNVLRSFIYALGKTRIVMVIMISSLPINFFLNYVLIYGNMGFPELGGAGAGYATSITYWMIAGVTAFIIKKQDPFSTYQIFSNLKDFSWGNCKEILKIGVPMGLSTFFETSMFAVVTILISKFSITTIAAYQSALNIVSFLYMVPVSISLALTVLVGYEVGAKRYRDARIYSWLGICLAIIIALFTGLLVVLFRYKVAGFYSNEAAVIQLTGHFLIYALFFQLSDAIQVTAQAALRGYKDVNLAFIMTLIAYWMICLPVGYLLAHFTNLGAPGYWIGLTSGLLAAGVGLSLRLLYIQKRKFVILSA